MSYYKDGIITIPNVSGNIVITATAVASAKPNLFEKSPSKQSTSTAEVPGDMVYLGARFNSSHKAVFWNNTQLITRPIAVNYGDAISVKTDLANGPSDDYKGGAFFYDASDNFITAYLTKDFNGLRWTWDDDFKNGTLDITNYSTYDISAVAYVRFCLAYTDIDSIVIEKQ